MQRYPMTPQGKLALEKELHQLKSIERPRIIAAIAEAREHGDLKENAEYHAAREHKVSVKVVFKTSKVNWVRLKLSM
jgi:transcription elongation factor GreA